jgi:aerobic C4-dicarboxylate transport protein
LEGLALLIGVDRFMSEGRAITNFIGNTVATVVIARSENAVDMTVYRRVVENRPVILPPEEEMAEIEADEYPASSGDNKIIH